MASFHCLPQEIIVSILKMHARSPDTYFLLLCNFSRTCRTIYNSLYLHGALWTNVDLSYSLMSQNNIIKMLLPHKNFVRRLVLQNTSITSPHLFLQTFPYLQLLDVSYCRGASIDTIPSSRQKRCPSLETLNLSVAMSTFEHLESILKRTPNLTELYLGFTSFYLGSNFLELALLLPKLELLDLSNCHIDYGMCLKLDVFPKLKVIFHEKPEKLQHKTATILPSLAFLLLSLQNSQSEEESTQIISQIQHVVRKGADKCNTCDPPLAELVLCKLPHHFIHQFITKGKNDEEDWMKFRILNCPGTYYNNPFLTILNKSLSEEESLHAIQSLIYFGSNYLFQWNLLPLFERLIQISRMDIFLLILENILITKVSSKIEELLLYCCRFYVAPAKVKEVLLIFECSGYNIDLSQHQLDRIAAEAVMYPNPGILAIALGMGANVNQIVRNHFILHYALGKSIDYRINEEQMEEVVRVLLDNGVDPNRRVSGDPPPMFDVDPPIFNLLLKHGLDITQKHENKNLIEHCIHTGNAKMIDYLLQQKFKEWEGLNLVNTTLFSNKLLSTQKIMLSIQLARGYYPSSKLDVNCLLWDINVDIFMFLVEEGLVDLMATKIKAETVIKLINLGKHKMVLYLISKGVQIPPTLEDENHNNILHSIARSCADSTAIEEFLSWEIDIHKRNKSGDTPLLVACAFGNTPFIETVFSHYEMEKEIFFSESDKFGNTLLHTATRRGDTRLVSFLIKSGFPVKAKNKYNKTALDICATTSTSLIMELKKHTTPTIL